MNQGFLIGVSIVLALGVTIVIHGWLHKLVKFKMDESAIVNLFEESGDNSAHLSTHDLSSATVTSVARVAEVCAKSELLEISASDPECWCLKKTQ